jgi:soluble lytic murein transglycosylase-like protein
MIRTFFFPALSFVLCVAASPSLRAAAPLSPSSDEIRARMEESLTRQRQSVATMAASVAVQQRSFTRQRTASLPDDFFRPDRWRQTQPAREPAGCESLPSEQVDSLIDSAAKASSVAPELIRGVMRQESAFRPCAVSSKGAVGLMQLEPSTAADLGVKNLFDPQDNILGGARLLRQLLNRYDGDLPMTLSAYNAGAGRVDAAMGVPMIPETMDYVKKILEKLPSASPLKQALEKSRLTPLDTSGTQFDLDSAPATSFWLIGSDSGR